MSVFDCLNITRSDSYFCLRIQIFGPIEPLDLCMSIWYNCHPSSVIWHTSSVMPCFFIGISPYHISSRHWKLSSHHWTEKLWFGLRLNRWFSISLFDFWSCCLRIFSALSSLLCFLFLVAIHHTICQIKITNCFTMINKNNVKTVKT